jgi:Ankyrin repeats (3 copies)
MNKSFIHTEYRIDQQRTTCCNREMKSLASALFRRSCASSLFEACQKWPPCAEKIRRILDAHPELIKERDKERYLPLHWVLRNKPDLEIVQYLIEKWPDSITVQDKYGRTCLHIACLCKASLSVVEYLIEQWPNACQVQDKDGYLPLHSACFKQSSPHVIQAVTCAWPHAVQMVHSKGKTPLHLAADYNRPCASRACSTATPSVVEWLEKVAALVDRTTTAHEQKHASKSPCVLSDTEESESEQSDVLRLARPSEVSN